MLLFRKSDFLQSRIVTRRFFLGIKLFCLLSEWAEKKDTWQLHDVFVKYLFFQLIRTTFIFWPPCYKLNLIQLVTWSVTNRDVLLLVTLQYLQYLHTQKFLVTHMAILLGIFGLRLIFYGLSLFYSIFYSGI